MPGSRSIPRVVSHRSDSTLGSDGWFEKLRTSASANRSQAATVRAEGNGERRERREERSRGARPIATRERDGRWLGAQNAWRGAEAGLWEPSSRMAKRRSWRTTYTSPSGKGASFCVAQRRRTEFLCSEKEATARGTRGRFELCIESHFGTPTLVTISPAGGP